MLISSKISNSTLTYLENQGQSLEQLYSGVDIPEEFLRDPSSWIEAPKMEQFLKTARNLFSHIDSEDLIESIGHACPKLGSWGALDSVLKMIEKPQDIFLHPERFLSYFISPEPSLKVLEPTEGHICFESPLSPTQNPLACKYLQSALEALPTYFDQQQAEVRWSENTVDVCWDEGQKTLFAESEVGQVIRPELYKNILVTLESKQKELEQKNKELIEKNKLLEETQKKLESHFREQVYTEKLSGLSELASSVAHEVNNPLTYVTSHVARLHDYLVRAQQLITILVGQDRETPQVREAMRRMDWDYISHDYPLVVDEANQGLQKVREIVKDLSFLTGAHSEQEEKVETDVNQVVTQAIKMVGACTPSRVTIDSNLFLDRSLSIYPVRLEQALVNILNNAVQSIEGEGTVRVLTRPKGTKAEIEITDSGEGMPPEKLENIFKPFYTTKQPGKGTGLGLSIAHSIIEMHNGDIQVKSSPGAGSTFLIDLPM